MGAVTAADAGCWLEGHRGWTAIPALVRIAQDYGFVVSDDDAEMFARAEAGDDTGDGWDVMVELADEAEAWMNEHVAPEGFSFGWHDGEFFLWPDEEWAAE